MCLLGEKIENMDEDQEIKCGNKDFNDSVNISHRCESCGKSFTHAHSLKTHIHKVHKGHKDYKCESCGKLFTTATYLKFHLKKHMHMVHEGHKDHFFKKEN